MLLLNGLRVLDLSRLLPGGYCTMLLADLGADVIKVEAPGHGDPLRGLPGGAAYFDVLHRGKRSIALRLKTSRGREAVERLSGASDVLLESFRPGVMERMGLGWERLREINPRLIYCAINGYGSTGPLRTRAGHDLNYLALSGALAMMPESGGAPAIPSVQVADLGGGVSAAVAILAALVERQRTGSGRRLEVAMLDVVKSWVAVHLAAAEAGMQANPLTGDLPCYHVYQVKDGFLSVAALESIFWVTFCQAIGREDLASRQADSAAVAEVAAVLKPRTRAEWMGIFKDRDVCVEPCLTVDEVLRQGPPGEAPILVDGARAERSRPAPKLGEHTVQVLTEAGLTPAEIEQIAGQSPG